MCGTYQARAGLQPARTWFVRIVNVSMFVYVYVSTLKAINNYCLDVMWYIYTPYDWFNEFYGFYMAVVVSIFSGCGVSNHMGYGN